MALHKIGLKGDCGCNYCLKCANEKTLLNSHDDSDHAVMKTVAKSELALTTDAEALASFNRLRDRKDKVSVAEFEQWEQCTGWSCSAFGILSHTQLHKGNVLFLVVLLRVKGLTLFKQCILEVQFKFAISLSDKKAVDGSSLEVTGARRLLLVALSFAYFCPLALSLPL